MVEKRGYLAWVIRAAIVVALTSFLFMGPRALLVVAGAVAVLRGLTAVSRMSRGTPHAPAGAGSRS